MNETFTGTSLSSGWVAGTQSSFTPSLTAASGIDTAGTGWLRLTNANPQQATYAYNSESFAAANATIAVKFKYAAYGGSGADGITFFLADASKTFSVGAYGGSLGYAQKVQALGGEADLNGMNGGYIGLGIDEFGNYSNPTEGRIGGIGSQPGNISIRGPGQGAAGYEYLGGTGSLSTPISFTGGTRPTGDNERTFQVTITATNQLTVYMQAGDDAPMEALYSINLSGYARPEDLILGFTGSTGGQTNIHEIQGLTLTSQVARLWDNNSADGTWGNATNWDKNRAPIAGADILLDNHYVSTAQTIAVGGTRSIRSLQIDAPFSYTLNGGTLEFNDQGVLGPSGIFVASANGSANHTINSAISAANAIDISNSSTGTLALTGALATNGNTVTLAGTGNTTLSGVISGTGALSKSGSGTTTLSGANTFSGGTTLRDGTLMVNHNTALGTGGVTIKSGTLASSSSSTVGNAISLQGNAAFSNLTTGGTLTQYGGDRTLTMSGATQSGNVLLSNDNTARTLTVAVTSGSSSITGAISNGGSGAGNVTKTGAGTLVLGGANTYTGTTSIAAGTVQLGASNRLADTSSVAIASLGTLDLAGFSEKIGGLTAAGGGTLNFGSANGANTFVFGTYTAPTSGVLVVNNWQQSLDTLATSVGGQTVSSIYFSGFGVAQVAGTRSDNLYGTGVNGGYLITPTLAAAKEWLGTSSTTWATGTNWKGNTAPLATEIALFDDEGTARPNATLGANTTVAGIRFGSGATVGYNVGGTGRVLTLDGAVPYVQQQSTQNQTISVGTLALGRTTVADITNSGNLTISSVVSGNAGLIRDGNGSGRLVLSGANTFTGGLYVNNGTVEAANNAALGTGAATVSTGATLEVSGTRTISNAMSLSGSGVAGTGALRASGGTSTLSGTLTAAGATTIFAASGAGLNLTGNLTGTNQDVTFTGQGNISVNQITTGTGAVTIAGTGTVTYAGPTLANSYNGETRVNSGTLVLDKNDGVNAVAGNLLIGDGAGAGSSATVTLNSDNQIANNAAVAIATDGRFNLNGYDEVIGSLSGSGVIDNSGAAATLAVGDTLSTTYSGTIGDSGSNLTLEKRGAGKLTLTNANTYAGGTNLTSGIIAIQNASAVGTGTVTVSSGANLEVSGGITVSNAMTLNGPGTLANDGAIQSTGGSNTLTGTIQLASDSRIVADGGSTLSLNGTAAIASTGGTARRLTLGGAGDVIVNKVIGTNTTATQISGLNKEGSGTATLTAVNLYTGSTTVNGGALILSGAGTLASTAITVNASELTLNNTNNNQTNRISNSATVTLNDGRLSFLGSASANTTETIGTLSAATGANTVFLQAPAGRRADLTINALNHTGTATLTFATDPTVALGSGATGSPRVFVGTIDGTDPGGSLTTPVGLAGWIYVNDLNGEANFAEYTGDAGTGNGIRALATYFTGNLGVNYNVATASILLTGASPAGAYTLNRGNWNSNTTDANLKMTDVENVFLTEARTLILQMGGLIKSGATTTTISGTGELTAGANRALAINVDNVGGVLNINSEIQNNGTTALIKTGAGRLTLGEANTFTGNVYIEEGAVRITQDTNLGATGTAKTIEFSGGTLNVAGSFTAAANRTWRIAEDATGTFDIDNGQTLTLGAAGDLVSGNSSSQLIKSGTGNLVLAADNTGFTGSALITAGTMEMRTGNSLGVNREVSLAEGAALNLRNNAATSFANHVTVSGDATINVDRTSGTTAANLTHSLRTLAIGNDTLTISGANGFDLRMDSVALTGNATFNTATAGTDFTVGEITGAGGITKNGAATMFLEAAASYTGATIINAGTFSTQGADRLPDGTAVTIAAGATLAANGNETIASLSGAGTVAMNTGVLTLGDASSTTFSGTVTNGGLTKNGTGTFTLSGTGSNAISGAVNVNDGTIIANKTAGQQVFGTGNNAVNIGDGSGSAGSALLRLDAANQLNDSVGVSIAADGRLQLNNVSDTIGSLAGSGLVDLGSGTLTTGGANTSTSYAGSISGAGGLTKSGNGTFTLAGSNSYSGATHVSGGTLEVRHSAGLGSTAGGTTVAGGATLAVANSITSGEALTLSGTGVGSAGALRSTGGLNTLSGAVTVNSAATIGVDYTAGTASFTEGLLLSGAISGSAGNALTKTGGGILALGGSAANTFSGAFNVDDGSVVLWKPSGGNATGTGALTIGDSNGAANSAVVLLYGAANQINDTSAVTIRSDGQLFLNDYAETIGSLTGSGSVALGSGALTIGSNNTSTAFSGAISGSGSVTKTGTGTLTLTGNNTYTGSTIINQGTLSINADARLGAGPSSADADNITLNGGTLATTATFALDSDRGISVGSGGGTISVANGTTLSFGGTITGPGELNLALGGSGVFSLTSSLDWSGTVRLGGGTLQLVNATVSIGTLRITGNTILDFAGSSSTLDLGNLIIDAGVTVRVTNWANGSDFFLTQAWQGAVLGTRGEGSEEQVTFDPPGADPGNSDDTAWLPYDGGTTGEITPVPEPSTYGAIFLGLCAAALGWIRWRKQLAARS